MPNILLGILYLILAAAAGWLAGCVRSRLHRRLRCR